MMTTATGPSEGAITSSASVPRGGVHEGRSSSEIARTARGSLPTGRTSCERQPRMPTRPAASTA